MKALDAHRWLLLAPHLERSGIEMFAAYGIAARTILKPEQLAALDAAEAETRGILAVLGFGGPLLSGTLAIAAPVALLERLHPQRDRARDERSLHDWLGEMGNRLIGRLKAKLLTYGVSFQISTPQCFSGKGLRGLHHQQLAGGLLTLGVDGSAVRVYFDAELDAGVDLSAPSVSLDGLPAEGEVMLF